MKKNLLIFLLTIAWGLAGLSKLSAGSTKTFFGLNDGPNWSKISLNSFGNEWNNFNSFDWVTNQTLSNSNLFSLMSPDGLTEPTLPCFFGEGGGNSIADAFQIETGQRFAVPITIPYGQLFELEQIKLSIVSLSSISSLKLGLYSDDGGMPYSLINSVNMAPSSSTITEVYSGHNVYELTFNLPTTWSLEHGTYYVSVEEQTPNPNPIYWESTNQFVNGGFILGIFNEYSVLWGLEQKDLVYYLAGTCQDLGLCNAVNVPYTEDFNSTETWGTPNCTVIETIAPSNSWTVFDDPGAFPTNHLVYSFSETANANSWFITRGVNLTAGTNYTISYDYLAASSTYPESMTVKMGTSANATGMTTLLKNHPTIINQSPITETVNFTVPSSGVYYFGFHANSLADRFNLYLDNIKVDQGYVAPSYCAPVLECSYGDNITNVNFKEINNPTICSPNGYGDFTNLVATVEKGSSNQIYVSVGAGWTYESVSVWIDYNNNLTFDQNEFLYLGTATGAAIPGVINIPSNIAAGDYRMRIRVAAATSNLATWDLACDSTQMYGETEDYTLRVIESEPSYCEPILNCTDGDLITNVVFQEISNPTACSPNGYGNYTDQIATVNAGSNYPISVTVGNGWDYESVSVWIDYDNSLTFDQNEFTYIGTARNATIPGNIQIPANLANGDYRMRVRVHAVIPENATWDASCSSPSGENYGETEDYTVRVVEAEEEPIEITVPNFPCYQGDGLASNSEGGFIINGNALAADDFNVEEGKVFSVQEFRMNAYSSSEILSTQINFHENTTSNQPGAIVETITMAPTSSRIVGQAFGLNIYELTFSFSTPFEFGEGKHWVSPIATNDDGTAVFWESTSFGTNGSVVYASSNGGTTWDIQYGAQAVFFISGTCEDAPIEITVPNFPCYQGDGLASNSEGGFIINGNAIAADDFIVEEGKVFSVQEFRMNAYSSSEILSTQINFHANSTSNQPGAIVETITMAPTSSRIVGQAYGMNIYELTFSFSTPFEFGEGKHWISPIATNDDVNAVLWESTSIGTNGSVVYSSINGGTTWDIEYGAQAVFFISGTCEDAVEPIEITVPNFPCYQGDGLASNSEGGFIINGNALAADDFNVEEGKVFSVQEFRMNAYSSSEILTTQINFHENATSNQPGAIVETITMAPTSSRIVGQAFGLNIYELTFSFSTPFEFGEGKHWVSPIATNDDGTAVFWESTSFGTNGSVVYASSNGGTTWDIQYGAQAVFFISGTCEDAVEPIEITVPNFPCYQGDGLGSISYNGYGISNNFRTADDFNVPSGEIFTVQQIRMNVISNSEITSMQFDFRENTTSNQPGAVVETVTMAPSSSRMLGEFNQNLDIYEVTFDLASPIVFGEGKHWLSPIATNANNTYVYWEWTPNGIDGSIMQVSDVAGATWGEYDGYSIFFISGVCEEAPIEITVPNFPCFQGDGLASNNFEEGYPIYGVYLGADDFIVEENKTFEVQQIRLNVFSHFDIVSSTINFRSDNAGLPGDVIETINMTPSSSRIIGNNYGFNIYEITYDLATPIEFTEGRYWLNPILTNAENDMIFWEISSNGSLGETPKTSMTPGTSWSNFSSQSVQSVFFISGTCEDVVEPNEGCIETPYGQYPYYAFLPSCIGTPEEITDEGYYGEYSIVEVTEGTEYIFSTDNPNAYITITDFNATEIHAFGTGTVTWTATESAMVRFIVHLNDECEFSSDYVVRMVQCGEIVPPPANDDCANAIAVSCGETLTGNTVMATNSGGNLAGDVFYKFTGDGTPKDVTISLCNSSYDTYLRVFTDCTLENEIAYNDDNCDSQSQLTFESDGTSTYYIMVEGYSDDVGAFELEVSCQDPIIITEPDFPCFQGDGLASNDFEDGYDVFGGDYSTADDFIVEEGQIFTVQQIRMNVFSGSDVTNAVFEFATDNEGLPGDVENSFTMAPTSTRIIGENYGYDIHELTFDLATPIEFTEGTYWMIPTLTNSDNSEVFWEVTTTGTLGAYTKGREGDSEWSDIWEGGYQTVFFISGTCEEEQEPIDGCLDAPNGQYPGGSGYTPSCSGTPEIISSSTWTGEYSLVHVTAGTEYIFSSSITTDFVTIGNADGTIAYTSGVGSVTWTATADETVRFYLHLDEECNSINSGLRARIVQCGEIVPPPANDDCENAIAVSCGDSVSGSTASATNSGGNTAADVFYTFTGTGTAQNVTLSLCNSSYDTAIRVFTDCSLQNQVAYNDDSCGSQSQLTFESDGTSTYFIMVEGWSSNTGNYVLDVTCEDIDTEEPEEGCLDTPNGQYPTTAFTPSCNGTTEVITDLGWFGEFSVVNVTAGTEYIFSTDVPTAFITIANVAGNAVITTGTGSVTWTATESGQVRFITHENSDCLSSENWVERYVQCGEIVPPPPYDPCAPVHEGIATNGVGFVNNGTDNYMAANDFNVLANTQFEVEKFTINIVTLGGAPTTFDLKFYEGETGVETQFGETMTNVTPSSITDNGTFGSTGYPVYAVEFTLPTTMIFPATATADKRYWIGVSGQPTGSGSPVFWVSSDYTLTDTLPTWQSENGGDSWFLFVADSGANVEGDLIIEGECATLGLSDALGGHFSYYPNPTKDILNITSDKAVEKVEVFNLAGQKLMEEYKLSNGQVNVKTLTPGTYVFRVTLAGGQVETFKVIKKNS